MKPAYSRVLFSPEKCCARKIRVNNGFVLSLFLLRIRGYNLLLLLLVTFYSVNDCVFILGKQLRCFVEYTYFWEKGFKGLKNERVKSDNFLL